MTAVYTETGSRKDEETPVDDSVFAQSGDRTTVRVDPEPEPTIKSEPLEGEIVTRDALAQTEEAEWDGDLLEFKGDTLQIRVPEQQALAAFSLASSKYVPMAVKNDIVGLFVIKHLSLDSYGHVMQRLMTPGDEEYSPETIGELMRAIVNISVERDKEAQEKAEAEAKAAGTSTS
ncbi:hypothetical protein SEA_EVAA_24 [Gordonia phage Evaa]|nr:hypothetical protein SEA_EVAA_24 [Gordonia phage Evaa]